MSGQLFDTSDSIQARAMFLGQRLDLAAFSNMDALGTAPLTIQAGEKGVAVLFRYGVAVFFGLKPSEIVAFLDDINRLVIEAFDNPEADDIDLVCNKSATEGAIGGKINLQKFDLPRIQTVADVLAKSVILAHYETSLAKHFDRIEPLAANLKNNRRPGSNSKELLRHIGDNLMIEAKMIGRVEVTEKPELIWDYPEFERLYMRLEDEFELSERHQAVDRKLSLISKTAETLLGIMQDQRTLRVEWYIVILIVVEILITLIEKIA